MFGSKKKLSTTAAPEKDNVSTDTSLSESVAKPSFFKRLKRGLQRTRSGFASGLSTLFYGKKVIDAALFEEIETQLLLADVGIKATESIMNTLTKRVSRQELKDPQALFEALKNELALVLQPSQTAFAIDAAKKPFVILIVGVNGVGKTTTIGKLANFFKEQQRSVLLAAGDTFRAAAVEQLQVWGERNQVPVVAQEMGADSASVIFDAVNSAKSRGIDVVIADTAGRLHNKEHLMAELQKIKRVLSKIDPEAPHATWLVLDASTGQNALSQAQQFHQAIGISGMILTKLDGTAKGGIIFALAKQMGLPVHFIGIGEKMDDLRPFDAKLFVEALFASTAED